MILLLLQNRRDIQPCNLISISWKKHLKLDHLKWRIYFLIILHRLPSPLKRNVIYHGNKAQVLVILNSNGKLTTLQLLISLLLSLQSCRNTCENIRIVFAWSSMQSTRFICQKFANRCLLMNSFFGEDVCESRDQCKVYRF